MTEGAEKIIIRLPGEGIELQTTFKQNASAIVFLKQISTTDEKSKVTFDNDFQIFLKTKKALRSVCIMGIPRVKVVNPTEDWLGTEYYIDEKKIEHLKSIDFHVAVKEVPEFTFETMGLLDIDMSGDIRFKFTPETVQQAALVLRNELMVRGELYCAFLESMLSALDDKFWDSRDRNGNELDLGKEDFKEAAVLMLNRLIGIEK